HRQPIGHDEHFGRRVLGVRGGANGPDALVFRVGWPVPMLRGIVPVIATSRKCFEIYLCALFNRPHSIPQMKTTRTGLGGTVRVVSYGWFPAAIMPLAMSMASVQPIAIICSYVAPAAPGSMTRAGTSRKPLYGGGGGLEGDGVTPPLT